MDTKSKGRVTIDVFGSFLFYFCMLLFTVLTLAIVHVASSQYVNFYKTQCVNALTNQTTKCWSMVSEIYMDSRALTQEKEYSYPEGATKIKLSASITNVTAGNFEKDF